MGHGWIFLGVLPHQETGPKMMVNKHAACMSNNNHQPPTTNHQPPTTNHQPPTTNHQPPTTNHQPPTTTTTTTTTTTYVPNCPHTHCNCDQILFARPEMMVAWEKHLIQILSSSDTNDFLISGDPGRWPQPVLETLEHVPRCYPFLGCIQHTLQTLAPLEVWRQNWRLARKF